MMMYLNTKQLTMCGRKYGKKSTFPLLIAPWFKNVFHTNEIVALSTKNIRSYWVLLKDQENQFMRRKNNIQRNPHAKLNLIK